jgi:hypothetical protein
MPKSGSNLMKAEAIGPKDRGLSEDANIMKRLMRGA